MIDNKLINITEQKNFYNDKWKVFSFINRLKLLRCIAILEAIASTKIKEPKIIDLGCGAGWLTNIVSSLGPTIGVDFSTTAISEASKKYPNAKFIAADILHWDYPKEAFDIVISQEVIEHMQDQTAYLEVAYNLLHSGGYLILTTPNAKAFQAMPEEQRINWSGQPLENILKINQLKTLLLTRFKIVRLTTIIPEYGTKGAYILFNSKRLRRMLEKTGLGLILDRLRLNLGYGLHILAVAQKI